jgi:hypothetical protein
MVKKGKTDDRILDRIHNLKDFERRLSIQLNSVQNAIRELEALIGDDYYPTALNPSMPPFPAPQDEPEEKEDDKQSI